MMLIEAIKIILQRRINERNKKKLKNLRPTLVCSNCTGGFLYHWLGLRFISPFINLYLTPRDFIVALENWEEFLNNEISEVDVGCQYPVGQVIMNSGGGKKECINSLYALS